jgi:hypothetical protein
LITPLTIAAKSGQKFVNESRLMEVEYKTVEKLVTLFLKLG